MQVTRNSTLRLCNFHGYTTQCHLAIYQLTIIGNYSRMWLQENACKLPKLILLQLTLIHFKISFLMYFSMKRSPNVIETGTSFVKDISIFFIVLIFPVYVYVCACAETYIYTQKYVYSRIHLPSVRVCVTGQGVYIEMKK